MKEYYVKRKYKKGNNKAIIIGFQDQVSDVEFTRIMRDNGYRRVELSKSYWNRWIKRERSRY